MSVDVEQMRREAVISPCERFRYLLVRELLQPDLYDRRSGVLAFCMLNPSTADADIDDRTVAKCCKYARKWGYHKIIVVNMFALRSTIPERLLEVPDPIGPENDAYIAAAAAEADLVICGWGAHKAVTRERWMHTLSIIKAHSHRPPLCFGTTKKGHPRHPLYVSAKERLVVYGGAVYPPPEVAPDSAACSNRGSDESQCFQE